jgi:hypothetical protein
MYFGRQHFGGRFCLIFRVHFTLKMEAVGSTKMLVHLYQITWNHISEDYNVKKISSAVSLLLQIIWYFICHALCKSQVTCLSYIK